MAAAALEAPEQANGYDVKGVEIFRVGEWNGDDYTAQDLDAIVAAFPKQGFGVPVIFGHTTDQPGTPAQGWVSNVYRQGDVLKADFKDLNWPAYSQILSHAYDHVSCEIFWNLKRNGATYTRALKAVALLGAETPAVSGLQPLREATFSADQFEKVTHASLQVVSRQMAVDTNPDQVKALKEATDAIAAMSAKLTALEAEKKADKEAGEAATKTLTDQIAAMKVSQTKADLAARADKCKVPALRDHVGHLYEFALTDGATRLAKFTDKEGKTTEKSLTAVVDEIVTWANTLIADRTRLLSAGGAGKLTVVPKDGAAEYEDASAEAAKRAGEYIAKHSLKGADGYAKALTAVLGEDAELASLYTAQRRGTAA